MAILARKIGIDLGSARTRIILPRKGIVLDLPSIVARDTNSNKLVAVGAAALEMAGKTPESIVTEYPLKRGVIADFGATAKMLRSFMSEAVGRLHISKPEIMISVSMTATSTEQRAVIEACEEAGAQRVYLIQPPVAAALGSRTVITEPTGNMIVDIGAGTTEVAVLSLGGIISKRAIRIGGNNLDDALITQLRRKHNLVIGRATAEEIKHEIGSIGKTNEKTSMNASGRSSGEGLPKTIAIQRHETSRMMAPVLDEVVRAIKQVIESTPPELVADIKKNGILLTGGGAQLHGLERFLSERLNTACSLVEEPQNAVVRGTKLALIHVDEYQKSLLKV